jgi:hypothetical protein
MRRRCLFRENERTYCERTSFRQWFILQRFFNCNLRRFTSTLSAERSSANTEEKFAEGSFAAWVSVVEWNRLYAVLMYIFKI